jgi:hypothetical protein
MFDYIPAGSITCRRAADHGQLDALKWLKSHGCIWKKKLVTVQLVMIIYPVAFDQERMAVRGMRRLVPGLLNTGTSLVS